MAYKIYLVEDEKNLNDILSYYMSQEGWCVQSFTRGLEAQNKINVPPDLWVIDIMLPDLDGVQLLKEIKTLTPQIPVIFISARNSDMDKIMGLEMGCDDYLAKPFLSRELIIRMEKLLNRVYGDDIIKIKEIDGYQVDKNKRLVTVNDKIVELTTKEFDMLEMLLDNEGQALSRDYILNEIWGDSVFYSDRVVDNLIRRLRKKLPNLKIETIYGFGYRRL